MSRSAKNDHKITRFLAIVGCAVNICDVGETSCERMRASHQSLSQSLRWVFRRPWMEMDSWRTRRVTRARPSNSSGGRRQDNQFRAYVPTPSGKTSVIRHSSTNARCIGMATRGNHCCGKTSRCGQGPTPIRNDARQMCKNCRPNSIPRSSLPTRSTRRFPPNSRADQRKSSRFASSPGSRTCSMKRQTSGCEPSMSVNPYSIAS